MAVSSACRPLLARRGGWRSRGWPCLEQEIDDELGRSDVALMTRSAVIDQGLTSAVVLRRLDEVEVHEGSR